MTDNRAITAEAFLCDSVEGIGGKLYAIGIGWNTIHAQQIPTRHPRIGIGVIIHVPYTATNEPHAFFVGLENEDGVALPIGDADASTDPRCAEGGKVVRLGGQFNVGRPPELPAGEEQLVTLAFQLDGVVFQSPGRYAVVLTIDDQPMSRLSFSLRSINQVQLP